MTDRLTHLNSIITEYLDAKGVEEDIHSRTLVGCRNGIKYYRYRDDPGLVVLYNNVCGKTELTQLPEYDPEIKPCDTGHT